MTARALSLPAFLSYLVLCSAAPLAAQTDATLRVTYPGGGAVFSAAELAALPQDTAKARFHDGPDLTFTGPDILSVLRLAGARVDTVRGPALRQYVQVVARDGYRVVFSLGELAPTLGDRGVLLVAMENGKPLSEKDGPWRLWVPGDGHPSRSVRQVAAVYLVEAPPP